MNSEYNDRVREIVEVSKNTLLSDNEVVDLIADSQAIIFDDHIELVSGRHSDTFLRFGKLAQYPNEMAKISREIAHWVRDANLNQIDAILSTSRAGMLIAYDVARELGVRAVYAKGDDDSGQPLNELQDGYNLNRGDRVLIVNDVTTTGRSLQILVDLANSYAAKVSGIAVFASRASESDILKGIRDKFPFRTVVTLKFEDWPKSECELCPDRPLIYSKDINSITPNDSLDKLRINVRNDLRIVS